ncbi:MAG TPA: arginase family protein, partial [Chthoniobacterales bacterium]
MADVSLVALPYDCGRRAERMGRGPSHLIEGGLESHLKALKHEVELAAVQLPEAFYSEGQALVELQRRGVPLVRDRLAKKRRVLLLSGNCGPAALTAVSALGAARTGVIWFDAHADFNTPETSTSGFLDGMALAILTGRCWPGLAGSFDNFTPVPEENVVLVGARDLDPAEANALDQSSITHIPPDRLEMLAPAIERMAAKVDSLYVHLDVDVLDETEGRANTYACRGGVSADSLYAALKLL